MPAASRTGSATEAISQTMIDPKADEYQIGRYQLGWRMVNLYVMPDRTGAWFNLCRNKREAEIHCGLDCHDPAEAFAWLCHEVLEMAMDDERCAFRPKAFVDSASDLYRFVMDHNEFTEVAAKASFFIYVCMADFKKAHAVRKKKPRRKRAK